MTTVKNHIVNLDGYRPHPQNYNKHSDAQLAKLQASLSKFGQVRSIVVWREYIIAGHGLTEAAKRLGWKSLRADVLDSEISESVALAYLVADNELARQSDPDQAALAAILDQVKQADAELVTAAGFSEQELAELLAMIGDAAMGAPETSNKRSLGGKSKKITAVLYADNVTDFEKAIHATGLENRSEAIMTICRFFLESNAKG